MGAIRMTKTFLPLIRQSKGRIVNTSSLSGRIPATCLGAYCVSKAGLETFSDVLRVEMHKWGVRVAIIEPGGFKTDAVDLHSLNEKKEHIWDNLDERTKATYCRQYFDKTYENFEASLCHFATDLSPVVRAMRSGLLSMKPRQRYYVGRGAATIITIFPFLPVWLADKIIYSLGFANQDTNPAGLQNN
ncbi:17-beta-hydroxysteroid dehydrogenase type 6 [Lamellibrachia satsuma]|nr:17-beta-hydroxysteroid dehydrogenase type 6 [Lamellibrachia satsuma]